MKKHFKALYLSVLMMILFNSFIAFSAEYTDFRIAAASRDEAHAKEGFSFIVGGALGLITSVTLGVTTKETLPKIGYTFVLGLSSAALSHGTSIYMLGDQDSRDHFLFSNVEAELMRYPSLSDADREDILTRLQVLNAQHWKSRNKDAALIRGSLQALTAVSAGATIYFARLKAPASQIGLGLLAVGSMVASISDFMSVTSWSETSSSDTQAKALWSLTPHIAKNEFAIHGITAQVRWKF